VSWIPLILAVLLGGLVIAGVVKQRRAAAQEARRTDSLQMAASVTDVPPGAEAEPAGGTTHTNRAGDARLGLASRPGGVEERLRERFQKRNRASLSFVSNDHSVLPDGRLKVFGRIQNNGGSTASQARVRVRILLDDGGVAAQ